MEPHLDHLNALRQRRLWWAGVLFAVLVIVGHDAMMAGNAHAASRPHHAVRGVELASRADEADANRRNANAIDHRIHTDGCSALRPGIRRDDGDSALDTSDAMGSSEQTTALDLSVDPWWREPTAPPRVRRALIQVFRI
ncbi:MAG: hypothetical protein M3354_10730 [Chloroflexota bacterium]|nr:hypothetical protein [Chloroflexota bacterium]